MKKFIDFEIVLILVILLLAIPIYAFITMYVHNIDYLVLDEKLVRVTIFIAIGLFVIVNFIKLVSNILKTIVNARYKSLYKKLTQDDNDFNIETNADLPSYGIVLASTIFYRYIRIDLLENNLKNYFETTQVFDERYEAISSKVEKIGKIEKEFLPFFEKTKNGRRIPIKSSEIEEREHNLQIEIENELKKLGYVKFNSLKIFLEKFLAGKNKEYIGRDPEKNPRLAFLVYGSMILIGTLYYFMGISVIILSLLIFMFLGYNVDKLVLTKKGKFERIRIIYLMNYLKNTEDLNDEEKLYYNVLNKIYIKT